MWLLFWGWLLSLPAAICCVKGWWLGLAIYVVGGRLLRDIVLRQFGYEPLSYKDQMFALPHLACHTVAAAGLSSPTTTAILQRHLSTCLLDSPHRAKQYVINHMLGLPCWVLDSDFSLNNHVKRVRKRLTSISDLVAYVEKRIGQPFPPDHPQWSVYGVEEFMGGGGSAVIVRWHHVYMDGLGAVSALVHNSDRECRRSFFNMVKPNMSLFWVILQALLEKSLELLFPCLTLYPYFAFRDTSPLAKADLIERRTLAFSEPMPLAPHLSRSHALGVTLNDYLVAAVLRTLRAYISQAYHLFSPASQLRFL